VGSSFLGKKIFVNSAIRKLSGNDRLTGYLIFYYHFVNSKNPYYRFQILNACFTNRQKRYWTKHELIYKLLQNDLIVSERSLKLDLQAMRYDERLGFMAPITYCAKERAYYYSDPDYSINKFDLTAEQLDAFSSIVDLMQAFKGAQFMQEFEGALDKVVRSVDNIKSERLQPGRSVIEVERAPYYKGMGHLDPIKYAIDNEQCLRIAYQKFTSTLADEHVFHPYLLKEFKGRWYVLGHSDSRNQMITLGLDRIEKLEDEPIAYKQNDTIKPYTYFKNTIGVTHIQAPAEEIVLWFSPNQSPYLKTQHLHETQVVLKDDAEGLILSLKLIINYELLSLLMSYCPHVSILKPTHLAEKFEELLRKGLEESGRRRVGGF
jgi:predicted DNA-binding transcriptional regulator YafY